MTAAYFQFINYKTHEEVRKIVIVFLNPLPTFLKNLFSKSNEICFKNRLYQWLTGAVVRCGNTFSMKQNDYIFSLFDTPDCCKCHKCAVWNTLSTLQYSIEYFSELGEFEKKIIPCPMVDKWSKPVLESAEVSFFLSLFTTVFYLRRHMVLLRPYYCFFLVQYLYF